MTRSFAKDQPTDGATIMHCGHLLEGPEQPRCHWFKYEEPVSFKRFDGTRGAAEWFAACETCFMRHGAQAPDFVRGDGQWIGNEPVIKKTELA